MLSPPHATTANTTTRLLWATDLHLDNAGSGGLARIANKIAESNHDAALLTGDISSAPSLCDHLKALARACSPRPLYFVLGNHDYYGGFMAQTHRNVSRLCRETPNLFLLDETGPVPLGDDVALVGHSGWADAGCGWGNKTVIHTPDHDCIHDFRKLSNEGRFRKMQDLGRQSVISVRTKLFAAFRTHKHVVVATHVPPFPSTAVYEGKLCGPCHQPHFINLGMGTMLIAVARNNPTRRITVLSGHTHSEARQSILPNLQARVGRARTGNPHVQEIFQI